MKQENTNKLFAVMLGGRAQGCHIELHDVVFVVGPTLEASYPALLNKWFGMKEKCHIDSSVELNIVDGYKISLSKAPLDPAEDPASLYFTNFGGYKPGWFGELHDVGFYVGASKKSVIKKASSALCVNTYQQHCDDNLMIGGDAVSKKIDDIIKIGFIDGYYITLTKTTEPENLKIESSYRRLDIQAILSQAAATV